MSGAQRKQIDEANKAKRARNGEDDDEEHDDDEEEEEDDDEPSRKKGKKNAESDDGAFGPRKSQAIGAGTRALLRLLTVSLICRCYGGG